MKTGTKVRVTYGDKSVEGAVVLANESGSALAMRLEGLIDGHVGFMAVNRDAEGIYHAVINGHVVTVEEIP